MDDFGYVVATFNGTQKDYARGSETKLHMEQQGNLECLKTFCDEAYSSLSVNQSSIIKQHTKRWFELRETSLVTGSTWYDALGLGRLSEQKKILR